MGGLSTRGGPETWIPLSYLTRGSTGAPSWTIRQLRSTLTPFRRLTAAFGSGLGRRHDGVNGGGFGVVCDYIGREGIDGDPKHTKQGQELALRKHQRTIQKMLG